MVKLKPMFARMLAWVILMVAFYGGGYFFEITLPKLLAKRFKD